MSSQENKRCGRLIIINKQYSQLSMQVQTILQAIMKPSTTIQSGRTFFLETFIYCCLMHLSQMLKCKMDPKINYRNRPKHRSQKY